MRLGEWVLVKGCGRTLKFKVIAFSRNRKGKQVAILQNLDCSDFEYRFVPVEQLEPI